MGNGDVDDIFKDFEHKVEGKKEPEKHEKKPEKELNEGEILKNKYQQAEDSLKQKYKKEKDIDPLVKESYKNAEKIEYVQNSILEKIKKKKKNIEEYSAASQQLANRFKKFFDKKDKEEKLLNVIDDEKHLLENQLKELIRKAHAFDVLAKKTNAKKYIGDLMKTYNSLDNRKSTLRSKMNELARLIMGH